MAIYSEPKNGDYARYIEELVHRGQAAPGQVMAKASATVQMPATPPSPGEVIPNVAQGTSKPAAPGKTAASRTAALPMPIPPAGQDAGATLAGRAGKRRSALAVTIVSLAIAWQAVRMLIEAVRRPDFDLHELVPVAFLLIFAGILWRAARGQRSRANQPPARLPPLTTISTSGKAKPGG
jgi:hypothetical protein